MTVQHTAQGTGAPTGAPPSIGAHYTDMATGDQYLAKGTAGAADWELQLSKSEAEKAFQPKGDYLTAEQADESYQPKGNYQPAGDYATQQQVNDGLAGKVDAVDGMGLSQESFTSQEKQKLAGLSAGGDTGGGNDGGSGGGIGISRAIVFTGDDYIDEGDGPLLRITPEHMGARLIFSIRDGDAHDLMRLSVVFSEGPNGESWPLEIAQWRDIELINEAFDKVVVTSDVTDLQVWDVSNEQSEPVISTYSIRHRITHTYTDGSSFIGLNMLQVDNVPGNGGGQNPDPEPDPVEQAPAVRIGDAVISLDGPPYQEGVQFISGGSTFYKSDYPDLASMVPTPPVHIEGAAEGPWPPENWTLDGATLNTVVQTDAGPVALFTGPTYREVYGISEKRCGVRSDLPDGPDNQYMAGNASAVLLMRADGSLLRSRDAGLTWKEIGAAGTLQDCTVLAYSSWFDGWFAVGATVCRKSTDDGSTWTELAPPAFASAPTEIVSSGSTLAVLAKPYPAKYSSSGDTWDSLPGSGRLPNVTRLGARDGYVMLGGPGSSTDIILIGSDSGNEADMLELAGDNRPPMGKRFASTDSEFLLNYGQWWYLIDRYQASRGFSVYASGDFYEPGYALISGRTLFQLNRAESGPKLIPSAGHLPAYDYDTAELVMLPALNDARTPGIFYVAEVPMDDGDEPQPM